MLDVKTEFDFNEKNDAPNNITGIYAIRSKYDGKNYVGKTEGMGGFRGRFCLHATSLRKNQHYNKYLQRSYNKHGEKQFQFIILEICNKNDNICI